MDQRTLLYYDQTATELAERYESADMGHAHSILLRHLPARGRVLEIGCGSGRDAAMLFANGYDVTGVDASIEMLAAARLRHPELSERLHYASLPVEHDSIITKEKYDGVLMIAVLMHMPDHELFECASQVRDMVKSGGVLVLSASVGRAGIENQRDQKGRLFNERPAVELQLLYERMGFRLVAKYDSKDSFAREVSWYTLVLQRTTGEDTRSIDEIETIITRDKKVATYKLALLRALCEIAQTESHLGKWRHDGMVSIPLGLVVEKWLLYYWPIIELDIEQDRWAVMPQTQGMEKKKPIAFRKPMQELIRFYRTHGGLSSMYHDFKSNSIPSDGRLYVDKAMNAMAGAIVAGPVTYAGGALEGDGGYFGFEGRRSANRRCTGPASLCEALGQILVPAGTWREMCLIGHWVAESLILRWAELTHQLSNRTVQVKDVVDRLLVLPESEREMKIARSVYSGLNDLRCVWTGDPIRKRFDVDHALPFSIWHNNDLWNLLPTATCVNRRKSDKLVTKALLIRRRDAIVHYWERLKVAAENRFSLEVRRSLVRGAYEQNSWQAQAFAGLVENVESIAIQRGLERWEP